MNISNYYWYFESAIPPRICDLIVKYGKSEKEREIMAITGGFGRDRNLDKQPLTKEEVKDLQKKRDSNIVWMNDRWIYKEIQPYVHQANANAGWNFDWDHSESCQFTIYKKGEQYQWHIDADRTKSSDIKLTALINVSDTSFSGGDFYLLNSNNPLPVPELNNSGSMIIFNSFTLHKINPIKKGIRKTITIFLRGPAFK